MSEHNINYNLKNKFIYLFQKVYKGTHINLPYVKNIKAESFSLDAGKDSFYNIDGDIVHSQKALVSVIPKAINLLI